MMGAQGSPLGSTLVLSLRRGGVSLEDALRGGAALHVEVPAGGGGSIVRDDDIAAWLLGGRPVVLQFEAAADVLVVKSDLAELTAGGRA